MNHQIRDTVKVLVNHLASMPWLAQAEAEELKASVSHWLQNPHSSPPLFTNAMQIEAGSLLLELHLSAKVPGPKWPGSDEQMSFNFLFSDCPYPPPDSWDFSFIDLFAGIGGFRLAFQGSGGKCVFTSEWDKYAKKTYEANFGEVPYGDIRRIVNQRSRTMMYYVPDSHVSRFLLPVYRRRTPSVENTVSRMKPRERCSSISRRLSGLSDLRLSC